MSDVLGMTHLALHTELSQEQREYLDAIRSSGQAVMALIDRTPELLGPRGVPTETPFD
jgi:hypothetical protein